MGIHLISSSDATENNSTTNVLVHVNTSGCIFFYYISVTEIAGLACICFISYKCTFTWKTNMKKYEKTNFHKLYLYVFLVYNL